MRKINKIIVHCSDTPEGRDIDAKEIKRWHVEERGWSDIAYHFVIKLDGTIEHGRPIEKVGAHAVGHNKDSVGICYVGGAGNQDTRTWAQRKSLTKLITALRLVFNIYEVYGHRELSGVNKYCPSFNVEQEYY